MMHTVTEFLRQHLLDSLNYPDHYRIVPNLDELMLTEWNWHFERLRRNRLFMGAFRYGPLQEMGARRSNLLTGLINKIQVYEKTGNSESIIDAANYCLFIWMYPDHKDSHFFAEDDTNHCPTLKDGRLNSASKET